MDRTMSLSSRRAWFVANLVFAMGPTLLFFAWVEQGTELPWLPAWLGWPWITPGLDTPAARTLWNAGLFFAFGLVHSALAQVGVQERLRAVIPAPLMRTFYLAVGGAFLVAMMALWRHTGVTVWALPVSPVTEEVLAFVLFAVPAVVILVILGRLDFLDFVGWGPLLRPGDPNSRTAGTPQLCTTGLYGWVRHPVYTCLLAMFLLSPRLTLDRLTVFAAACLYLAVGIPVEERKLIRLFGDAYVRYCRRVPALLPLPRRGGRPREAGAWPTTSGLAEERGPAARTGRP
jgi:protein-S-isoprenylcysteine O-methyltransferase Ste14